MSTDTAAIVVALSASYVATLRPSPRSTFGYHRAEILAALINAVVLLGVCGYLAYEGVRRLLDPFEVNAQQMLAFASVALAANLVSSAFWRAVGVSRSTCAEPSWKCSATRSGRLLILPRAWSLLRDCVGVLLEAAPPGVDMEDVRRHLAGAVGVTDVHDLHAWQITSGMAALSAHVTVADEALENRGVGEILDQLEECVATHFGIDHATSRSSPRAIATTSPARRTAEQIARMFGHPPDLLPPSSRPARRGALLSRSAGTMAP